MKLYVKLNIYIYICIVNISQNPEALGYNVNLSYKIRDLIRNKRRKKLIKPTGTGHQTI